jgi:hypothetical protein
MTGLGETSGGRCVVHARDPIQIEDFCVCFAAATEPIDACPANAETGIAVPMLFESSGCFSANATFHISDFCHLSLPFFKKKPEPYCPGFQLVSA